MEKFKVIYNIKNEDRNSKNYGVLIEKHSTFDTLQGAMRFVRDVGAIMGSSRLTVIGKPVIERA